MTPLQVILSTGCAMALVAACVWLFRVFGRRRERAAKAIRDELSQDLLERFVHTKPICSQVYSEAEHARDASLSSPGQITVDPVYGGLSIEVDTARKFGIRTVPETYRTQSAGPPRAPFRQDRPLQT